MTTTTHSTLISLNQFNPNLCDGVSNTLLEVLLNLKAQGYQVSIYNFLTNETYRLTVAKQAW